MPSSERVHVLVEFEVFSPTWKHPPELRRVLGADGHPPSPLYRAHFYNSLFPASADSGASMDYSFFTLSH